MPENEQKSFLSAVREAILPTKPQDAEELEPPKSTELQKEYGEAPLDIPAPIQELLERGAHFGHKKSRLHPSMLPFIIGVRNTVHIIDAQKTDEMLGAAEAFLEEKAKNSKIILFVGTKPAMRTIIREAAERCGMPYVVERWAGGTLTNWKTISLRIEYFRELEAKKSSPEWEKYTKQERARMDEELRRLTLQWAGIRDMRHVPDVVVVGDAIHNDLAVREANTLGIPVVALADTDVNIKNISHPIPANDDSRKASEYIFGRLSAAVAKGRTGAPKKQETPSA